MLLLIKTVCRNLFIHSILEYTVGLSFEIIVLASMKSGAFLKKNNLFLTVFTVTLSLTGFKYSS